MATRVIILESIWSRVKSYSPYILFAIVLAEIAAYSVIGRMFSAEIIITIPKFLFNAIYHGIYALWNWLFITIGPMMFGLFPLAGICVWAIVKLLKELRLQDEDIVKRTQEKFGGFFLQLFNGKLTGMSRFEADKKLCQMLAYSANNCQFVVDRLYRRSKLYSNHWDNSLVKMHNGPTIKYKDLVLRVSLNKDTPSDLAFVCLEVATELAVIFGFAGTILAMMATMGNMSTNLSQFEMIDVLLKKSSSAFGSTVTGIFISVPAYLASIIFKRYFPEPSESPNIEEQILFNALTYQQNYIIQPIQSEIINGDRQYE